MSKNNVNPDHYKVAGRARQGEDIAQTRNRQKYAEAMVRERTEKRARARKAVTKTGAALKGVAPARAAKTTARKSRAKSSKPAPQLNARQASKRASVNLQGADKRGKRSTAQKRASARHEFEPMPATKAVAGAFGKEPSPRWRQTKKR